MLSEWIKTNSTLKKLDKPGQVSDKLSLKLCMGLALFAGIDSQGFEFLHYVVPNVPLGKFQYNCGSKFILDDSLFQENGSVIGASGAFVLLIQGSESHLYGYYGGEQFLLKKKITGNLVKRHSKGGQSSVRFSRLAEESRQQYCVRICDSVREVCLNKESTSENSNKNYKGNEKSMAKNQQCIHMHMHVYVVGSQELREQFLETSCQEIKTITFVEWKQWASWNDATLFINQNKKEFHSLIETNVSKASKQELQKIKNVIENISKNPDILCFGQDLSKSNDVEYIVATREFAQPGDIIVEYSSDLYAQLIPFKRIGKLYFSPTLLHSSDTFTFDDDTEVC